MSSGDQRQYMITLPANYDMNKPYRYIYASHGLGGEGADIAREKYYGIQSIPAAADSVIFVSASGLGGAWGLTDVPLFDDILEFVKQNTCVDTSRVFVLGFSFGGMYSYSLSMTRQKTIRAGIGMAPANYNIPRASSPRPHPRQETPPTVAKNGVQRSPARCARPPSTRVSVSDTTETAAG